MHSRKLAGIVGPTLLAVSLTEAVNLNIFSSHSAPVIYLNGTLLFIAGLAIIRAHSQWSLDWRAILTLIGWLALMLGLYRMTFPNAPQMNAGGLTYALLALLAACGAILTYQAYLAPSRNADRE